MSDSSSNQRWRPQFSLSTLVLFCLFLGAVILLVLMRREVDTLRSDNVRLAAELGQLYVTDKSKIMVLAPKQKLQPQWTWSWRISVPEKYRYSIRAVANQEIPLRDIPKAEPGLPISGEFTLDARLQRDRDGNWELVFGRTDYTQTRSFGVPGPEFLTDVKKGAYTDVVGSDGPLTFDAHTPVVLLRVRENKQEAVGGGQVNITADPAPCPGVLIWIEEDKPKH